jgi:type IV pilus assembly protein PilA
MIPPATQPNPHRHLRARGFTLAELLIGVAIVGVLASMALVSYRKYIDGARISEPIATLQAIRASQEQVRRETGHYFNVSTSNTYFPMNSGFGSKRVPWDGTEAKGHGDYDKWKALEVTAEGPMRFGYKANAGLPGGVPSGIDYVQPPPTPTPTIDEWFVLQAKGDPDQNGKYTQLLSVSFPNATQTVYYREDQ